jgi:glycosyltransferase involved in cell wall biosynthesis
MSATPEPARPPLSFNFVGQTPPPYGGQTVMNELVLRGHYQHARLHHVATAYSRSLAEMKTLQLRKALHLVATVLRVLVARVRHRGDVLYFSPSGPERLPLLRDIVTLLSTRWAFRFTVFHFHAGGLSELVETERGLFGRLLRRAFTTPDAAIRLSPHTPPDAAAIGARREFFILNTVAPVSGEPVLPSSTRVPIVLTVGLLSESKGLFRQLDVSRRLRDLGVDCVTELVGEFDSVDTERATRDYIAEHDLNQVVEHRGVLIGAEKEAAYRNAAAFSFLTEFPSETTPLVIIEAMQAGLPIVASRWRGIPDMVEPGVNAVLVEVGDTQGAARALANILQTPDLRARMGAASKRVFDEQHGLDRYHRAIDEVFSSLRN